MEFGIRETVKEDFANDFVWNVCEAVHVARCAGYQLTFEISKLKILIPTRDGA